MPGRMVASGTLIKGRAVGASINSGADQSRAAVSRLTARLASISMAEKT